MQTHKVNLAPYLLVFPSMFYLFLFFGWPMLGAVRMAFERESQIMELYAEADDTSEVTGKVALNTEVTLLDYSLVFNETPSGRYDDDYWYYVRSIDEAGEEVEGWVFVENLRGAKGEGDFPDISQDGILRASDVEALPVYESPDLTSKSTGAIPVDTRINVWRGESQSNSETLDWFQISDTRLKAIGWIPAEYVRPYFTPFRPRDLALQQPTGAFLQPTENNRFTVYASPSAESAVLAHMHTDSIVTIDDYTVEFVVLANNDRTRPQYWYHIEARYTQALDGVDLPSATTGWIPQSAIMPTLRPNPRQIGLAYIDPAETFPNQTLPLYGAPTDSAEIAYQLPVYTQLNVWKPILASDNDDTIMWFLVSDSKNTMWGYLPAEQVVPSGTPTMFSAEDFKIKEGDNLARGARGSGSGEFTLNFFKRMFNDARFEKAIRTTVILMMLILPIQFVLAIIMALILQAQIKGNSIFLYIYTIPLGVSDLAAGLVWYSIFTQSGFLNSFLEQMGLIEKQFTFIGIGKEEWMITIIVLAEVWRATSIVMVIVVSGLQAIPRDYLEAGELFGANLWQRLWHIVLPMLKPSLQVALILRTILAFQVFAVVVAITGGEVITVLANETYRWYDPARMNNPNMAAAYATFIMVLSLGISMVYLRAVRSQEESMKR
ncbi:MAG: ABC transporter permease subunit [Anaerolineales bacterium]|nr:ABC transporter permease subunit [Anaerolineales bacterium]